MMMVLCELPVALAWGVPQSTSGHIGMDPYGEPYVWTDSLEDMTGVYVPVGGLVGVEVVGGEVRLKPGHTEGWVASAEITCPVGLRYDLVYLEVEATNGSYVQLTILDATKEPTQVGYANETVPGFDKERVTERSVRSISASAFPRIRMQVNLVANGTYQPRLLGWHLFFTGVEEWRDELVGSLKRTDVHGLNLTGGSASIDLSAKKSSTGGGYYDPYPTLIVTTYQSGGTDTMDVLRSNDAHTGYKDKVQLACVGSYDTAFADFDLDGDLDMVLANYYDYPTYPNSAIYWNDGTDTWSNADMTAIAIQHAFCVDVADLNGDGAPDIIFGAAYSAGSVNSALFLNNGDGTFDMFPDLTLAEEGTSIAVGDINYDGYDDFVYGDYYSDEAMCHLGGPNGPTGAVDLAFDDGGLMYDIHIADVDNDGYLDVVKATDDVYIYSGDADGPDENPDITILGASGSTARDAKSGDFNGDGYTDLLVQWYGSGGINDICIYLGDATGLDVDNPHVIDPDMYPYHIAVADIDKDGFCDFVVGVNGRLDFYFGAYSLPTTCGLQKTLTSSPTSITFVIPKGASGGGQLVYRGTFTTEEIVLPATNSWDMFHIDGTVPANTSIVVSVLDGQKRPITGWQDIPATDLDLSALKGYASLRFKVMLMSDLNTTTPEVDRVLVKWIGPRTWRDEFFGLSKTDRMVGLEVRDGALVPRMDGVITPHIVFASMRSDAGLGSHSQAFRSSGANDYSTLSPFTLPTVAASAVAAADVNGDGFNELAFATYTSAGGAHSAKSPMFLGSPVGWRDAPLHEFPTTGASDVLVADVNGDGRMDVVFAQEFDGTTWRVDSTLFWGNAEGSWNATPDVQFATNGASGVVAADIDGDGRTDLAFACYKDAGSTSTDSMVFLQADNGTFNGDAPSHALPTKGARAVDAADINGDGRMDLAFANSFSGGFAEIDSYVYWGKSGGGFEATPAGLRTAGAEDVRLADLDGDSDVDVVFANSRNNVGSRAVDSYVYMNGGSGAFAATPDARLPTVGASAVAVADLDGTGRKDIVFACECNGTGYDITSYVYMGGASAWPATPSLELPTHGARDVAVARLGTGASPVLGYLSKAIMPEDVRDTGHFETLRYDVQTTQAFAPFVRVVDAETWETLAESSMTPGGELALEDAFKVKEHPSVRIMIVVKQASGSDQERINHVVVNWTKRVKQPPTVLSLETASPSVLRLQTTQLSVEVADEYDPARELRISVEQRLNGTSEWSTALLGVATFKDGAWALSFTPKATTPTGDYDFRVRVTDMDNEVSAWVVFGSLVGVVNNLPTAPEVRIDPGRPVTTSTLQVVIVRPASDVDGISLSYRYRWFRDGELVPGVETDTLSPAMTARGQNWSVSVSALDGEDEGPAALAWKVIQNAPPQTVGVMPDPELAEDTTDDQWIDLSTAFSDPDGDPLLWALAVTPEHLTVTIDPATGKVTIAPQANWFGQEEVTFVASDGELQATRTVTVTVTPVNDAPYFVTVDGKPIPSGPISYKVRQGQLLVVAFQVLDVEGDELVVSTNSSLIEVDEDAMELRFQPGNEAVGTLRFQLRVRDVVSTDAKASLDFVVEVENENDPMDDPRIINPRDGDKFKVNVTFSLLASCTDPDMQYGQVLNFTWTSNVSGVIGYGSSLTVSLRDAGRHLITLTVRDPSFEKTAYVEIIVEQTVKPDDPGPGPGGDDDDPSAGAGTSMGLIAAVLVVVVGALVGVVAVARRRARDEDDVDVQAPMTKEEALRHMVETVKESVDALEADLKANGNGNGNGMAKAPEAVTVESRPQDGIEVMSASVAEQQLTMQARVTETASEEVAELWQEIAENGNGNGNGNGAGSGTAVSEADKEQMRLDSLKRKYHNAIGRLPYGIPAEELRGMDWVELSATLATGEKRTTPDGRELTSIDGRWYFSDPEDSSTFLKEHGARSRNGNGGGSGNGRKSLAPEHDRSELLAKLEERFILGEISEEAYKELKRKYRG